MNKSRLTLVGLGKVVGNLSQVYQFCGQIYGGIHPTAVLQSSLETQSPTPFPELMNHNQETELKVLGNMHYAPLCNCVIIVLYMLDQRLTENWRMKQSVANSGPNPAGR